MQRTYFVLAVACLSVASQATVLTFSNLGVSGLQAFSNAYGDNVQSTTDAAGSYLMGNAWTPNVTTSYQSKWGAQSVQTLSYWSTNYSGLSGVAISAYGAGSASITLTAEEGYLVRLNSFELGAYPNSTLNASLFRILDGEGNVLFDKSGINIGQMDPVTSNLFSPKLKAQQLTIEWGMNYNIGIDNVNFDQQAVPEPTTLGLAAIALVGLKRRRK